MKALPMSLRTEEMERSYQSAKELGALRPLAEAKPLVSFKRWKLIKNDFPYDLCFKKHHMFVPKRQFAHWYQMNLLEFIELIIILKRYYREQVYDLFFFNTPKKQSVKNHFHLHAAEYYEER